MHGQNPPSAWVLRWSALLPVGAQVLDLACGAGRHLRHLSTQGHRLTGVDRDGPALADLARSVGAAELIEADIENGPWPLPGRRFDLVLVTNYLWRPLLPRIVDSVAPGGLLIYETFAQGHEALGRPSRPEFLLRPGELLSTCAELDVLGFESGRLASPERIVQRIAARRPAPGAGVHPIPPWRVAPDG